MDNLVSKIDGGIPSSQEQLSASAILDKNGILINPSTKEQLDQLTFTPDGKLKVDAVIETGDIEIGAVELKDGISDARVKIKTDGVDNALVVMENFSNFEKIIHANDLVITVNYTDSNKSSISSVVKTSASLGLTQTQTFNNSGATTLVITRT